MPGLRSSLAGNVLRYTSWTITHHGSFYMMFSLVHTLICHGSQSLNIARDAVTCSLPALLIH